MGKGLLEGCAQNIKQLVDERAAAGLCYDYDLSPNREYGIARSWCRVAVLVCVAVATSVLVGTKLSSQDGGLRSSVVTYRTYAVGDIIRKMGQGRSGDRVPVCSCQQPLLYVAQPLKVFMYNITSGQRVLLADHCAAGADLYGNLWGTGNFSVPTGWGQQEPRNAQFARFSTPEGRISANEIGYSLYRAFNLTYNGHQEVDGLAGLLLLTACPQPSLGLRTISTPLLLDPVTLNTTLASELQASAVAAAGTNKRFLAAFDTAAKTLLVNPIRAMDRLFHQYQSTVVYDGVNASSWSLNQASNLQSSLGDPQNFISFSLFVDWKLHAESCAPVFCDVTRQKFLSDYLVEALATLGGVMSIIVAVTQVFLWPMLVGALSVWYSARPPSLQDNSPILRQAVSL